MIKEQLAAVETNICQACERAGRDRGEVTLIAVSKTKPVELIEEAMAEGLREFGENKVQEIRDKYEKHPEVHWHMIGHLQRNKVKYIADKVTLIHSVDSLRLAQTIEQEGAKCQRRIPVLLEVNMAGEASKFGIAPEDTLELVRQISVMEHVAVEGLMTIAPFVADPEENRIHFRNLYNLSVDIKSKKIDNVNMSILSMGMTNDYEVAIEEGATMVRVGTALFGARQY